MRFNELLESDEATAELLKVAKLIKKECQPYLQQNSHAVARGSMYRGVKPPGGHSVTGAGDANVIRKEVRLKDRKPTDMPLELHQFINHYFDQEYGALFRFSMFASGSIATSSDYGTVYVIFPIGDFEYLWSPKFEDLFTVTGEYDFDIGGSNEEEKEMLANEVLSTYQNDELVKAIDSNHEIMVRCKAYYGIHVDVLYNGKLRDQIHKVIYS